MTQRRHVRSDDAGFTLPELLVAVVAVGIVMPALVAAFVTGVRTTTGTTERLAASNDAEFASSWFVPDVQSAASFSTAPAGCFNQPAGSTHLFTATRTEGASTITTGYATAGDATPPRKLLRYSCTDGVADPVVTVAHSVSQSVTPVLTCTPSPCGAATTKVALSVTSHDATAAGYTFHLNATRRTS